MNLWLGITLILIVAGGFLAYPFFFRRAEDPSNQSQQANVDIFRDQQNQYHQQLEQGEISQQQYAAMLVEAEQLLLSNTAITEAEKKSKPGLWMLPILVIIIPLATLWMYQSLGASADEKIAQKLAANASTNAGQQMAWDKELITLIAERVKQRPNNVYYWTILAQEAVSRGDMSAAADYFSESLRIEPRESYLLGQYAQALFFAEGNKFTQPVITALDNAFAVDSSNQTVLGLKGIQAFESRDYKLAISYWQGALQQLNPASSDWQALQSGIQKAQLLIGDAPAANLSVALSIDSSIQFAADQIVFIAVVAADGSPMPIAARKLSAGQLPTSIQLSDNDALMAGRDLSSAGNVRVVARLSTSGTATPQAGDWEAISEVIEMTQETQNLELNISQQRAQ
ncbi:MAG: c-type cytochrome biogenesis protein CcmI [Porticoccaceae bacterium]|nr:c-type cytochrome biogenesis protein CcmI [Porticoccaceae bacterium]